MKKVILFATAAFLFSGVAFASGDGKKCAKSKDCGKEMAGKDMKNCSKDMKDCCKKETAKKTTTKPVPKA